MAVHLLHHCQSCEGQDVDRVGGCGRACAGDAGDAGPCLALALVGLVTLALSVAVAVFDLVAVVALAAFLHPRAHVDHPPRRPLRDPFR